MNLKQASIAAAIALSTIGISAHAQQPPSAMPMHQPMMGGPGYGYGQAPGGGPDMGPGMMWGGRPHMGAGMMGGYRGYGMGPGMMMGGYGLGPIYRLDLNDDQRRQLTKIDDELRRRNWDLMGKMQDEMARLRDATWAADKRDRNAILAASKRMSELRQQMLENRLDAEDKAEALLTAPQKEQLRQFRRWRYADDE
jgi:Spy/CpxP family protein refolding chaperone